MRDSRKFRPTYSVVIPTLNEERFLPNLLSSLVAQSQQDFEVIVVDGASKDETVAVAKSYERKLPRLSVIVSQKASLPLQRNLGAKKAGAPWLVFIDADSVLLPHFFERVSQFIAEQKPQLFTTWCRPDSEARGDAMLTLLSNFMVEGSVMVHRPLAPGPLTMVARKVYDLVGGYDEQYAFNEDMDFSLRIYNRGINLQILRETLYVISLRRLRAEGRLKVIQLYIRAALPVLFLNRTTKYFPGYIMGGQNYNVKRKTVKHSTIKRFKMKLQRLVKELVE